MINIIESGAIITVKQKSIHILYVKLDPIYLQNRGSGK